MKNNWLQRKKERETQRRQIREKQTQEMIEAIEHAIRRKLKNSIRH